MWALGNGFAFKLIPAPTITAARELGHCHKRFDSCRKWFRSGKSIICVLITSLVNLMSPLPCLLIDKINALRGYAAHDIEIAGGPHDPVRFGHGSQFPLRNWSKSACILESNQFRTTILDQHTVFFKSFRIICHLSSSQFIGVKRSWPNKMQLPCTRPCLHLTASHL